MNINDWLLSFKKFWIEKDVESVLALFSDDVEYFETPERKLEDLDEIKSEWEVVKEQDGIMLSLGPVRSADGAYEVDWQLSYYKQGKKFEYSGIYKIRLNESGKCDYFMQIEK